MQLDPAHVNEHVFSEYFPGLVGIELTHAEPGRAECRLEVRKALLNPGQRMHGGVAYTMADTTMAFALMPMLEDGQVCTTLEIKVTYITAVQDGVVTCATKVIKKGSRIAFLESEIRNGETLVAKATGTYYIIGK